MDPFFARNRLSAYLDGELPSGEAREVEDALAQSPELRAELDSLRAAIALLRRGGPIPAPRDFARKLDVRIAKEPLRVGWRRHVYGFRMEVGMLAAAAAIVLVFAAQKPDEADGAAVPAPAVDVASVPGLDNEGPSIASAPPDADGVLGGEPVAKMPVAEKNVEKKPMGKVPTPPKSKGSKSSYEKEAFVPAWEQGDAALEPAPTVQSGSPFKFRLKAHGDTGLRDLASFAASRGGKLTDARGKELAPYPMNTGERRTVKLLLPSGNAGDVAARLYEYGDIEVINLPTTTLYANGATVPVEIEVTAP
ncbi:MAG: zf-HC2 domain-containing protein [Myxococcota bacterium]